MLVKVICLWLAPGLACREGTGQLYESIIIASHFSITKVGNPKQYEVVLLLFLSWYFGLKDSKEELLMFF